MENNTEDYNPGTDQNQGVVGTMARNQQHEDTESDATQVPQLDPNLVMGATESVSENTADSPNTEEIGEQNYVNDEGVD